MNAEASALERKLEAAIRLQGGLESFRRHALQRLKVRAVVKESHGLPIAALAVNTAHPGCRNLFATIAGDQATIYDNSHLGDHLGVVAQYTVPPSPDGQRLELTACAWLPPQLSATTTAVPGDALLALGVSDGSVHVISVAEAAVVRRLDGPDAPPVDISSAPGAPAVLLALCRGNSGATVWLWDVGSGQRLVVASVGDALCAALSPCGTFFVTGASGGRLLRWTPAAAAAAEGQQQQQQQQQQGTRVQKGLEEQQQQQRALSSWAASCSDGSTGVALCCTRIESPGLGTSSVDTLSFLPGGHHLLARALDGRTVVTSAVTGDTISQWRVPGCSARGAAGAPRCGLAVTADGCAVAAGNPGGHLYVFSAARGERLATLEPPRPGLGALRGCGMSEDGRHVLAAAGSSYIFRFEYSWPCETGGGAAAAASAAAPDAAPSSDQGPAGSRGAAAAAAVPAAAEEALDTFGRQQQQEEEQVKAVGDAAAATGGGSGAVLLGKRSRQDDAG